MNIEKELGLDKLGITNIRHLKRNLSVGELVKYILANDEGVIELRGAIMVDTGIYTGRSPQDRYIVAKPSSEEKIWWGPVNRKISESIFKSLYKKVIDYYNQSINVKTYLFDGFAGGAPKYALNVRIIAKKA